ncbi:MAG: universal stress protein [Candidatus Thermoplasmatota archaeon]|jgi:nucleotide-binding universal stress UspA family protein|nr:universal stress protein [Candidatus Thermoplasmatota archaeon]
MAKMVFNLILCAVDFSPESMKALTMAESLLNSESGTKLMVLYAYEPVSMPLPDYLTAVESGMDIDSYLEKARAMMTNNVERINMEFGSEVCEGKIVMGKAVDAILKVIEERNPDIVVMGNRKPGFKRGIILGSVSERVASNSPVSVLIVR